MTWRRGDHRLRGAGRFTTLSGEVRLSGEVSLSEVRLWFRTSDNRRRPSAEYSDFE